MASTRYIEFSITTTDGTSTFRVDDRQITSFPIEAAITTEVNYSLVGSSIASGNRYDGRVLWTGAQFLIKPEEYPVLLGLVRRQELQRRNRLDYAIAFKNVLYPFVDANSTRTRAIATGSVTTNADGTIQYFARHNVAIVGFSVDRNGSYYTASMDWQELDLSA
jgi:hypothetical protein